MSEQETTPQQHSNRKRILTGALFVFISAVSWGISGTCAQFLTQWHGVQVEWINSMRMICSAIILMPLCLARRSSRAEVKQLLSNKQSIKDVVIYAIFGAFTCQIGYLFTISYTNAGTSTMMEQTGMVIVVAVTCLQAHRRPYAREITALILALGGCFCLCTQGNPSALAMPPIGLAWGIFASISMATYVLLPVRLLKSYSGLTVTSIAMVIAGIFCCVVFQPWNRMPELSLDVVLGTAGTIVLGVIVAYLLFLEGVKRCGPVLGGLLDAAEPVTALACSALCLGTAVTEFDVLGCILIVSMMILVTLPEKKPSKQ